MKDDKIKPIRQGIVIEEGEEKIVQESIVNSLKKLLASAEAGDIQEIAYAAVNHDYTITSDYAGDIYDWALMSSALGVLERMYNDTVVVGHLVSINSAFVKNNEEEKKDE